MRRTLLARGISGAGMLALLTASSATAQVATPPPDQYGESLYTTVVSSALDDPSINRRIEDFTRDYHDVTLGGVATPNKPKRNGWFPVDPQPSTRSVVDRVVDAANENRTVVVVSGGDPQSNVSIARNYRGTTVIDLMQSLPCVTEDGQPDPSGTCAGGASNVPFNYTAADFMVEDGAYLTGVLAASAARSRNDRLGIVSGAADCERCNRYVRGFVEGARATNPDVAIEIAYLADDEVNGFSDEASARTFTSAFIDVFAPDVILAVARAASPGIVEAACDNGVLAVGTDVDISTQHPEFPSDCILASVTVDIEAAIEEALYAFADKETVLRPTVTYDLTGDRVAVTDEWRRSANLPVDTAERYEAAHQRILTGQVDTCPGSCGGALDRHGQPLPAPSA